MQNKIYFVIAIGISMLPFSWLRVMGYRVAFKYKIKRSKIGWLTVINIKEMVMENASVGAFNIFTGPFSVRMYAGSHIGGLNYFRCGKWATEMPRKRGLIMKESSLIVQQNYFDLFGMVSIGKDSLIAGVRSQFWTHGSMSDEIDIVIGDNCYIGSGVKFAAGTELPNDSLCAMGSIVTRKFVEKNCLIAGVPAKKIRSNVNWRENWK